MRHNDDYYIIVDDEICVFCVFCVCVCVCHDILQIMTDPSMIHATGSDNATGDEH